MKRVLFTKEQLEECMVKSLQEDGVPVNIDATPDVTAANGNASLGMKNAKNLIDKMKEEKLDYQFIEVMNCIGGCIAGGGQPKLTLLKMKDGKLKRIDGLYSEDEKMKKRVSYKNPDIIKIYKDFYGEVGSSLAHQYLHTSYKNKSYLLRGEDK